MNKRAFTLIELLTVIAIIGVLAAILLPALARARENGRRVSCMSHLSQLGMVFHMYADENDGRLPWSGGNNNADCLLQMNGRYYEDEDLFGCPSDPNWRRDNWRTANLPANTEEAPFVADLDSGYGVRASYDYFGAYTKEPICLPPPEYPTPRVPIMWDLLYSLESANHVPSGGNVLLLDGSVTFLLRPEWYARNLPLRPPDIEYEGIQDNMPFDRKP